MIRTCLYFTVAVAYIGLWCQLAIPEARWLKLVPLSLLVIERKHERVGLIFALIGDAALMHPQLFYVGLASFSLFQVWMWSQNSSQVILGRVVLPLFVGIGLFNLPLYLRLAIWLYSSLIVHATLATIQVDRHRGWGMILFCVSDALLAVDRFVQPFPLACHCVMATYWTAIWLATHPRKFLLIPVS